MALAVTRSRTGFSTRRRTLDRDPDDHRRTRGRIRGSVECVAGKLVVWGGIPYDIYDFPFVPVSTGAVYDLTGDRWRLMTTEGAPAFLAACSTQT